MAGWTKLFSSIVTSSVWCEDDATLRVWIAMLATADHDGVVEGSIPGFANLARVTLEQMVKAVEKLSSPDPHSRTPDHEGRRIEAVECGWQILNYAAYRERAQAKEGSRAPYFRQYRSRKAGSVQQKGVARNTEVRGKKQEVRGRDTSTSAPPPNLLEGGKRPALEREAQTLIGEVSELTGEDPAEVLARVSRVGKNGPEAYNIAAMSENWLATTLSKLRAEAGKSKPTGEDRLRELRALNMSGEPLSAEQREEYVRLSAKHDRI